MSESLHTEFLPQLLAAIDRHEDAENWASWGAVVIAADAVRGDELSQRALRVGPEWKLTASLELPTSEDVTA